MLILYSLPNRDLGRVRRTGDPPFARLRISHKFKYRRRETILAPSGSCRTLGRGLVNKSVDVLGTQLKEVIE